MAQLSSVISSILRDYITAQHEANSYIQSLAHDYGKEGKLKGFQLPQAMIDGLELELKYAVQDTGVVKEDFVIDYEDLYRFFSETLTPQLAKVAITTVVFAVNSSDNTDDESLVEFQNIMDKGEKLRTDFGAFLGRKIDEELRGNASEIVTEGGEVNQDKVLDRTIGVVFREFLRHPDLEGVMSKDNGEALKKEIRQRLQNSLSGLLAKLVRDFTVLRKQSYTTVEVVLAAEELKELPSGTIQSLRFRIGREGDTGALTGDDSLDRSPVVTSE